ncbi:hypothetical protein GO308_12205 [Sphingomonas sp. SFZ2018-12]|uniref:PKD domain-containing protein n=1 Tax=Sphingomonas sp. SFZ2018-12 TaxID=2683197 RepID=UPI001F11919C|nr:hypothetical protein [Sphingomonas sp. SFZ2018-12]MCH4893877.1 hypothetical protein [Sphingomonas sp. SFZ2018-12]
MISITKRYRGTRRSFWSAVALATAPIAFAAVGTVVISNVSTAPKPVDAGPDQTIMLPTNEVTLIGTINGVSARWVTRAGAERSTVISPNSATTRIVFASEGTYKFELQSFDARGRKIGSDSVKVFVQKASTATTGWRERILNADGSINAAEYRYVASNINTDAIIDYRLGPKYADFDHSGEAPAPTLWGPDQTGQGLWPFGSQPTNNPGEPEKCLPPERQPGSDQEELARGLKGGGWLIGGQLAFVPEAPSDPNYRYGISNVRTADGAYFDTGGLCMRMIAAWNPDWWNRGNIATPAQPQIRNLVAERRPDLPLVPVAIARGRANASQVSFAAFKDGTIAPVVVGNSDPEFFDDTAIRLPAGMVPTAMAVTPYNEFLVVSVWDTNTVSGKLAFIALKPRQMANGAPWQTPYTRWYWGTPGAWTNRGMKLLGFTDLPFAAPTSVDVSNNLVLGNPRGYGDNAEPARGDLSLPSARKLWSSIEPIYSVGGNQELGIENQQWSQLPSSGYAVVASRAENKVSFVDMTPLYQYYRQMYLTTQANFDQTVDQSTTDPNKWPFTFAVAASQRPVVVTTLDVQQPTSVSAGVQANGTFGDRSNYYFEYFQRSPKADWSGVEPERYIARSRAFIASMDGTVRIFNVQGLNLFGSPVGRTVPAQPLGQFQAGRNPRFAYVNSTATASDDLWLISRGDRRVTFAWPTGDVQYSFTDSRLVDPVGGSLSINLAGYGGRGPGLATFAHFISILDYSGKSIITYGVEPRRERGGGTPEIYPFRSPTGPVDVLWGSTVRFPGKPFMIDGEEII